MIKILLDKPEPSYQPSDSINGTVEWNDHDVNQIDIRLIWYTSGKGDRDTDVIDHVLVDQPEFSGRRTFAFTAPKRPYSFSGKLVSLSWAIEAISFPDELAERIDFAISPTGKEVILNPTGEKFKSGRGLIRFGN